jgi:cell pole-organizing protein PopZ
MLQTWIHRIKPGKEQRLREWLTELNTRADEVREAFSASGVRAEQAFVLSGATGSLLIYVSEAAHHGNAAQAFAESNRAIDVEHRRVMEECVEEMDVAPVYDVSG